ELRWRKIHPVFQAVVEELAEGIQITGFRIRQISHRFLGEEQTEHAAGSIPLIVETFLLQSRQHSLLHGLAELFEMLPTVATFHLTELSNAGRHGQRVS